MKHFRLIILLFFPLYIIAQPVIKFPANADPSVADEKFNNFNFNEALKDYTVLVKKEPSNGKYNYRLGFCYLYSMYDKKKAVPYLEKASKAENPEKDALYYLTMAYHYANRFDDAITTIKKYIDSGKGTADKKKLAPRWLNYAENAKELIKKPVNVSFKNLGKNINTIYPDYQPFVPEDETYLVFTTRRKEGGMSMMDGGYTASVFMSKVVNGEFAKAKSIGPPINTGEGDEEVVGLSATGDLMILVYDNEVSFADLFYAYADKKGNFKKAEPFDESINSKAQEIAASVTADGNTLFFTSLRTSGLGGSDLYYSRKLPNGKWSIAQNIAEINTDADEDFPNVTPDGKVLYFSSNGPKSMGGYDIFKATLNEETGKWENIQNIGYPINTPDDDMNLRLNASGKYGYIAAVRDEGYGDMDIYRVDFKDQEAIYSLVKGKVTAIDSSKVNYADVQLTVKDKNGNRFGDYIPNAKTGNYVLILPVGEYTMIADVSGYEAFSEKIVITEKVGNNRPEINKNLVLTPVGYVKPEPKKTGTTNKTGTQKNTNTKTK